MTAVLKQSARDRLLAAANELFYNEGVHTVGIDRIIEHAGVAKASLYNAFGSKDELVRAYLELRFSARRDAILAEVAKFDSPREKLLAVFGVLDETFRRPGFHGCAFVNASAEAQPGSAAEAVPYDVRRWTRTLLVDLAREAGVADPDQLGQSLHLLYDGAVLSARMDRDPGAAQAALAAADVLITTALPAPVSVPPRSGPRRRAAR